MSVVEVVAVMFAAIVAAALLLGGVWKVLDRRDRRADDAHGTLRPVGGDGLEPMAKRRSTGVGWPAE